MGTAPVGTSCCCNTSDHRGKQAQWIEDRSHEPGRPGSHRPDSVVAKKIDVATELPDFEKCSVLPSKVNQAVAGTAVDRHLKPGSEYTIQIDGTIELLGIEVDSSDGIVLLIGSVTEGLVKKWNDAHPDKEVRVGDRLVEVNGIRERVALVEECNKDQLLTMKLVVGQATCPNCGNSGIDFNGNTCSCESGKEKEKSEKRRKAEEKARKEAEAKQKEEPKPSHPFMNGPTERICTFEGRKKCDLVWTDAMGYYKGEYNCDRCGGKNFTGKHWHCPKHYCDYCRNCEPKVIDGV